MRPFTGHMLNGPSGRGLEAGLTCRCGIAPGTAAMRRSAVVAEKFWSSDRLALQATSGSDPKASDDICKRYDRLLIFKLPLATH